MVGEHLHRYDLEICDYLIGNVVSHMDNSDYIGDLEKALTCRPLLHYLVQSQDCSIDGDDRRLLLNDAELDRLELVFSDELDRSWFADEDLHRRYLATVAEVREHVSRQAAEDWSADCAKFARQLETPRTRLWESIGIIREWVGQLRTLLRVMGALALLPAPEGGFPTPTYPDPPQPASPPPSAPTRPDESADGTLRAMLAETQALQREVRDLLVSQRQIKNFYTTAEVAQMLGKAEFTIREWCRRGRARAEKQGSGRGKHQAWVIAHEELQRLQREGLLPAGGLG
jgi:hypothetical protein